MNGPPVATQSAGTAADDADHADIVGRLRAWMTETALPFWLDVGADRARSGFHERLHADGRPDLDTPRRVMVQARQIYVYAHATALGWGAHASRVAEAVAFVAARFRAPDGRPGYVFSIAPDGSVADARRDTYAHMFILLAFGWAARLTGDAQIHALVEEAMDFATEHLSAGDGTFLEGIPPSLPRRQNPHMHAFEAMLALHETVAHPRAMPAAERLRQLLEHRFLDQATGTIGEFFTDSWEPALGASGTTIEPGHHAEWAWLLRRYERLAGAAPGPLPGVLLERAARGRDARTGLLFDEIGRDGTVRKASHRTWPQTEFAKAWLAEAEAGHPTAAGEARQALAALSRHYLDRPVVGGWTDQIDSDGRPLTAHIPASTLYHLFGAVAEADRVLGSRLDSGNVR